MRLYLKREWVQSLRFGRIESKFGLVRWIHNRQPAAEWPQWVYVAWMEYVNVRRYQR